MKKTILAICIIFSVLAFSSCSNNSNAFSIDNQSFSVSEVNDAVSTINANGSEGQTVAASDLISMVYIKDIYQKFLTNEKIKLPSKNDEAEMLNTYFPNLTNITPLLSEFTGYLALSQKIMSLSEDKKFKNLQTNFMNFTPEAIKQIKFSLNKRYGDFDPNSFNIGYNSPWIQQIQTETSQDSPYQ
jgi:hypothetical protein